ncbi:hypothetical protein JZ751_014142, partial [Albula glossodonta]
MLPCRSHQLNLPGPGGHCYFIIQPVNLVTVAASQSLFYRPNNILAVCSEVMSEVAAQPAVIPSLHVPLFSAVRFEALFPRRCVTVPPLRNNDELCLLSMSRPLLPRVPSGPRNLISIVNGTSVILEWHPPRETGSRDDVVYNIICKKCRADRRSCSHCDDNVEFVPRQLGLTETRVFISNLWAHTLYTFEVQAVNGVTNKSPYPAQHVSIDITTNQAGENLLHHPPAFHITAEYEHKPNKEPAIACKPTGRGRCVVLGITAEGCPSPSMVPIMHQVSSTMRSITLSWPQPEQPNGIILDYELRYYEK